MPGWLSNGVPPVAPSVQNGVTVTANGIINNGVTTGGEPLAYSNLGSSALIPADTETSGGAIPQTVATTPFQIAAHAAAFINNTATSTTHTATLNTEQGMMYTESLSTAAGGTYTFQLVNSLITATGAIPQVQIHKGTCTQGGEAVNSITNATGTATVVFANTGAAAWNGTMVIGFHV